MADRPLQRSFSFDTNDQDIPYKPQAQSHLPAPPPSSYKQAFDRTGYQVAAATSYMQPDPPRDSSPSPSLPLVAQPPLYPRVPAFESVSPYRNSRADLEALRQDYGRSPSPDFPDFTPTPLNLALSYGLNGAQQHPTPLESTTPKKPLPALPALSPLSAQWPSYSSPPPPPAHRALSRRPSDEDTSGGQHPLNVAAEYSHQRGLYDGMNSPASAYSAQSPSRRYADHRLSGPPGSFSSNAGMLGAAAAPGQSASSRPSHESSASGGPSMHRHQGKLGNDLGYHYPPSRAAASMAEFCSIDPTRLADDDDDDGLDYARARGSPSKQRYLPGSVKAGAPVAFLKSMSSRGGSGQYGKLVGGGLAPSGVSNGDASGGGSSDKSEWLDQQTTGNKRLKWLVGGAIALIIVLAIVGGAIGAVVGAKKSSSTSVLSRPPFSPSTPFSSSSSSDSTGTSLSGATTNSNSTTTTTSSSTAGLTKDSPSVKALLNNPALHKVFPGIDYTPANSQYPACLTLPPSQDDVTKDVAVLSQLTPVIRLYGTDCNQTQLVLHAIAALGLTPASLKVWLGVWQDANATTNARQLAQMWDVLDTTSASAATSAGTNSTPFAGVIVGNEVLFRQDMPLATLTELLASVRANLTRRGGPAALLPVATSDLGSEWTPALAAAVDVVMANVHPFFAGVAAADAAAWTYAFWQGHDVALTPVVAAGPASARRQIVSEVGWPSGGGSDCGTDATGVALACADADAGSVAGVAQLNRFLEDWVCQSLANGTEYFWFEAFDEPWKDVYNTATQQWEDKWGLMDVARNLKAGITIPSCGGARAG